MLPYLIKFCTISSKPSYGSSHWGAGVLFPGLAIKWKQSQGAGWLYRSGPTHVPMYIPISILHWSMLCAYARNPVTHNHVVVAFVICIVLYCIVMYVLYHFVFLIIKKKKKKKRMKVIFIVQCQLVSGWSCSGIDITRNVAVSLWINLII